MVDPLLLAGLGFNFLGAVILASLDIPRLRFAFGLIFFPYTPYRSLMSAKALLNPDVSAKEKWIREETPFDPEEWAFVRPIPESMDETEGNKALWRVVKERMNPLHDLDRIYLVAREDEMTTFWREEHGDLKSYPVVRPPGVTEETRMALLAVEFEYENRIGEQETDVAALAPISEVERWIEERRRRFLTKVGAGVLALGFLFQLIGILV